jgi:hypothetical protein
MAGELAEGGEDAIRQTDRLMMCMQCSCTCIEAAKPQRGDETIRRQRV